MPPQSWGAKAIEGGRAAFFTEQHELREAAKEAGNDPPQRQTFDQDSLQELAESIKSQGIVQPVVVRPETRHEPTEDYLEIMARRVQVRLCSRAAVV